MKVKIDEPPDDELNANVKWHIKTVSFMDGAYCLGAASTGTTPPTKRVVVLLRTLVAGP